MEEIQWKIREQIQILLRTNPSLGVITFQSIPVSSCLVLEEEGCPISRLGENLQNAAGGPRAHVQRPGLLGRRGPPLQE